MRVETAIQLYFVALGTCVLLMAGRWVARWWRFRRVRGPWGTGACGGCGYTIVRGSPRVCSECGGDLGEVGLLIPGEPRTRRPVGMGPVYVLVVLLAFGASLWLTSSVARVLPFGWGFTVYWPIETGWRDDPTADFVGFTVQAKGTWNFGRARPTWISIHGDRFTSGEEGWGLVGIGPKGGFRLSDGKGWVSKEEPLPTAVQMLLDKWQTRVTLRDADRLRRDIEDRVRAVLGGRIAEREGIPGEWVSCFQQDWLRIGVWGVLLVGLSGFGIWGLRRSARGRLARRRRVWEEWVRRWSLVG